MSYFGRRDPKQTARDAIVGLRQQLQMIEKKEEYLQKKIDTDLKLAKANAVSNKAVATAALKRKKANEQQLDQLRGTQLQLEMQVNTLESANLNSETLIAMKKAADALQAIQGNMTVAKVDQTMAQIQETREVAEEIAGLISDPGYANSALDDDELQQELRDLEEEVLNDRLMGDKVPIHIPAGPSRVETSQRAPVAVAEDDEEEQLRQLQAEMAM